MMAKQLNIRLSPELHEQAKRAAEQQQISLNQFCRAAISRAVGEAQARRFFCRSGARSIARDSQTAISSDAGKSAGLKE